jgi:hypothetical protein
MRTPEDCNACQPASPLEFEFPQFLLQAGQIGHSFSVASVNVTLAAIVFDG